ncbi:hypothetical protein [Nonomuraea jabiensis]|uniref:hypothetical protein n=1 Tax=Nonomuraea jabiensis TaxID=882448 RepID=UPI0036CDA779
MRAATRKSPARVPSVLATRPPRAMKSGWVTFVAKIQSVGQQVVRGAELAVGRHGGVRQAGEEQHAREAAPAKEQAGGAG